MAKKAKNVPTTECVIYLRVSSDKQAESGLGISAQRKACEQYARDHNLKIVGTFDDCITGSSSLDKRPGLANAIASVGDGQILLVAKRDRLARDMLIMRLIERDLNSIGARVVSAAAESPDDDEPSSKLMRALIDAFGEYERAVICWRTAQAMAVIRARGGKTGGIVPYGKRIARSVDAPTAANPDKKKHFLEDDPYERKILDRIMEQTKIGMYPKEIARRLNEEGIPTRTGVQWIRQTVAEIIGREIARTPVQDDAETEED